MRLIEPSISYSDLAEDFKKIFDSGMFTRGPYVQAFREKIRDYTGAPYVGLTTSATTALWIALKLLNIQAGDEVIVSDFSFPATANVVEDLGAVPIFADVDLATWNMQPEVLEAKITSKTRAVIFVDCFGNPSGLTHIQELCTHHRLPLIEDAACAFGSAVGSRKIGAIADITCFSFHPRKILNTGEGGAICVKNPGWIEWLERKLAHGASGPMPDGPGLNFSDYGYNFRMTELQAAMGLKQIDPLDDLIDGRRSIAREVTEAVQAWGWQPQRSDPEVRHNLQSLVFKLPDSSNRNAWIRALAEQQVESTLGTYALSSCAYYQARYACPQPHACWLQSHTLTLPCYPGLDVERLVTCLQRAHTALSTDA